MTKRLEKLAEEYGKQNTVRDHSESEVIHEMLCMTTSKHFLEGYRQAIKDAAELEVHCACCGYLFEAEEIKALAE